MVCCLLAVRSLRERSSQGRQVLEMAALNVPVRYEGARLVGV